VLDLSFKIAGQAGQGMQAISFTLGKLLTRVGYYVFVNQDVMSRIRGGHNFAQIRISDSPVFSPKDEINVLIALDDSSLDLHKDELVDGGVAIYDQSADRPETTPEERQAAGAERKAANLFQIPMTQIAKKVGKNPIMVNSVALGAMMYLTGYPLDQLLTTLQATFAGKGDAVIKANLNCAQAGYDYAQKTFRGACPCKIELPDRMEPPVNAVGVGLRACPRADTQVRPNERESGQIQNPKSKIQNPAARLFMTGNEAIALGAICSGVKFHSGYPMSPSTPIMEYLAAHGTDLGIVVEQSEDEIAGINMALGASYAGVRAMTATSGGGFALMVEGLGLSAISETPIVIVLCQRPGPATGFPTRTEQGDLLFALHASQDEFPRFIFAPGTAEQAFYLTNKAFDLSQKYQVPAFVLADQFLCDSYATIEDLDLEQMRIERYDASQEWSAKAPYTYSRYAVVPHHGLPLPADVCPRVYPGTKNQIVVAGGHEHDEQGYITESAEMRTMMMDRRLGKTEAMRAELGGIICYPETPSRSTTGTLDPTSVALICFGSTYGAVREAVDILRGQNVDANMVHLSEVAPLPGAKLTSAVESWRRLLTVENNATAQLARLIHAETKLNISDSILKYDGRPFTAQEIVERVKGREIEE